MCSAYVLSLHRPFDAHLTTISSLKVVMLVDRGPRAVVSALRDSVVPSSSAGLPSFGELPSIDSSFGAILLSTFFSLM